MRCADDHSVSNTLCGTSVRYCLVLRYVFPASDDVATPADERVDAVLWYTALDRCVVDQIIWKSMGPYCFETTVMNHWIHLSYFQGIPSLNRRRGTGNAASLNQITAIFQMHRLPAHET